MKNFWKVFGGNLVISAAEILVGILLLVNPLGFTRVIVRGAGVVLLVLGAIKLIDYYRDSRKEVVVVRSYDVTAGIMEVVVGLILLLGVNWLLAAFAALTILYGIFMLVGGVVKLQWAYRYSKMNRHIDMTVISAAVTIIVAVIIITNPFSTTVLLWKFIGVSLIVTAVIDLIAVYRAQKMR